jgi:peroxiredoxin
MPEDLARPRLGDAAPGLTLATESGESYSLEDDAGKPVLLSFLSHAA